MRIGIIEAGSPPAPLAEIWGSYAAMAKALLGPTFDYADFSAPAGQLPSGPQACGAYLITGSAAAAYDPDPWIARLEDFIRSVAGAQPLIGVCFGHQLMAQALGGSVRRHPAGWGLGLHRYEVEAGPAWLLDAKAVRLPASHQDQVVSLGPQGRVLASSAFTPFAMVEYPALKCLSLQPHPEFEPEFAAALIQDRRGGLYSEEQAAAALSSLAGPNDRVRVAGWLRAFMAGTR